MNSHPRSLRTRLAPLLLGLGLAAVSLASAPLAHAALVTVIPPPANRWEAEALFIIDKDTNSVFLNANALYVASLTPSFPDIRTPEDLVGKTDYDFYPPADAAKYQADDARVIASGTRFETIEENQLAGGERLYNYAEKEPLRDANGVIFGLRVKFYFIPQPNQTVIPPPRNAHEAATVIVIDKDTNSTFINANDLYIRSLQAAYPEIQSVTNLIGKNDYAFYPEDLAEKYRADDARVLATGRPFVTIEGNEVGGVRRFFHVRKEPLRDRNRRIFGLRITAFPLPANEQALDNNFRGGTVNSPRRLPQAGAQPARPARGVKR